MPFVEVSRQTFAMPSGSRREVNIALPGSVYDPTSQSSQNNGSASVNIVPILDEGTYGIMISVSGSKCTQEVTATGTGIQPTGTYNIGDMYGAANVQYYGCYTEHMGACQYKKAKSSNIYTAGALIIPDAPDNFLATPIVMLPQSAAVRTPARHETTTYKLSETTTAAGVDGDATTGTLSGTTTTDSNAGVNLQTVFDATAL